MPARSSYDYAIVRVVPSVSRGEFINAGIILFCRARRYLEARIALNREKLLALSPAVDLEMLEQHLAAIPAVCRGGPQAGPIGQLSLAERYHWLVAPRSTVIQISPGHSGLCFDPADCLEDLLNKFVR